MDVDIESKKTLRAICILLLLVPLFSLHLSKFSVQQKKKIYYTSSMDYLELISGSFRPLFAEMIFIKGILGLPEEAPDRMSYFLNLFNTSIDLDPKLINAYFLGGVVVPTGKEEVTTGIKFLKKGMALNPSEWRIPFWIGFNYLELGVYSKVIKYYRMASDLPGSPPYLKTNLAFLYYKANRPQEGLLYLKGLCNFIKDNHILKIMKNKIKWLEKIVNLEKKIEEYREMHGVWPLNLDDLVKRKLIKEIPDDPFGKGYYLEKDLLSGIPKVRSKF